MNTEIFKFTKLLSKDELKFLRENLVPLELKKDTILFYKEDVCKDILLIEQGEISLYIW
jgi:CRP/FNR family transcriptional regulator